MSKWEMVRLGDVCTGTITNIAQKDLAENNGDYPIYGASGLIKFVNFYFQDNSYLAVVKDGAGVGRVSRMPAKSSIIGTMQYILPNKNVDVNYLYYTMVRMNLARFYSGATIPHIYFKDYKKEYISLPPLPIQQKIADILDYISNLIDRRKEQIKKFDLLVKSRFVGMFGDPVTNPMGWKMLRLGELGELNRGISKHRPRNAPELLGGDYPLIQTGEIAVADLYITNYKSTYSEIGLHQSRMWPKETLCITIAANIAKTAILKINACFPDSVVGFISGARTNQIYIHFWFSFFQKMLEEQAPESAQKNINLQILRELNVILPPLSLQTRFADFVKQVDKTKFVAQDTIMELEKYIDNMRTMCYIKIRVNSMPDTNINIRVDNEVKKEAQALFSTLGLDMTTAINIFLRQAIRLRSIPFSITAEPENKVPKPGCMKGKVGMAEDFDAPLEDFKEYM